MENKQFDILMKTIGGINDRLDRLEASTKEEIKSLKEGQKSIMEEQIKEFNRLDKKIDKYVRATEENHIMFLRELRFKCDGLKDENEEIRGDINALHFLSKTNELQHKEYDKLLSIKRA